MAAWYELLVQAARQEHADDHAGAARGGREAADALVVEHGHEAARNVSRLLARALGQATPAAYYRCPRCAVVPLLGPADKLAPGKCLSRVTGAEGGEVFVCEDCGDREAMSASAALPLPGLAEWPVPIGLLLREDKARYEVARGSGIVMLSPEELPGDPKDEEGR
jgi:hypothetical protein